MKRKLLPLALLTGLLAGLASSGLMAQVKPATIIPKNPIFTMHIDGPAALRAAFLPTNLGKMFAGPEFKDMIAPVKQMIESGKEQLGGEVPFDLNEIEKAIYGYRGRISAAFHLLDEAIDFTANEPPAFTVTIVLTPDGKTDLAAFCKKSQEFVKEKMGEALEEMEVGGKTISYFHDEDDHAPGFSVPFMHKDQAVILITKDLKKAAEAVLAEDAEHHSRDKAYASASLGLSINVKKITQLLSQAASDSMGPEWDDIGAHILKGSGVLSIDSVDMTYRAKGPALLSQVVINFNQNSRGVIGAFFQAQSARSSLIAMLPRGAMSASAMPFDLKTAYKSVKAIFESMGDAAPTTFDEVEEQFKEHFGLRLFEDLIGLFGENIMTIQMETDEIDVSNPLGALDGMCFGFDVSDGVKMGKTIDTMLRKDGLHAGRKKKEYKGFTVYDLTIAAMFELHYAVTDNLLLLGIGGAGGDAVRAGLDEAKNRADGQDPVALPKSISNRLNMVSPAYTGLGWSNVQAQSEGLVSQLDAVAGSLPPEFDMFIEMLDKMPPLLKTYGVNHQVAVIRTSGNRWVYENIW
jgi:hypothetical protein